VCRLSIELARVCYLASIWQTLTQSSPRSRPSWSAQVTTGFVITKLASERNKVVGNRNDETILQTMKAIRDRLK